MNDNKGGSSSAEGKASLSMLPSGLALICLGAPDERVVTLTPVRMESIRDILDRLREQKPKGAIFAGSHEAMFTAGADISLIRSIDDPAVGEQLARYGQHLFNQIESLPFPTAAAISGPCVGGGCELALACTYRIITKDKSSIIGLPEIKLGILPGFGGTQRLPRLIGLPKALDVILGGKVLKPQKALEVGLVDQVVHGSGDLIQAAETLILRPSSLRRNRPGIGDRLLTYTLIGRSIVASQSRKAIQKETKGFYPAPLRALETAIYGLERGSKEGYVREARDIGVLATTPESKSLINLFFLTEASKGYGRAARKDVEQLNLGVIGAGVMGAGIAGVALRNGATVTVRDTSEEAVQKGIAHVRNYISGARSLSQSDQREMLGRLKGDSKDVAAIKDCSIVVEAVFERLDVKQKVLSDVSAAVSPGALIASNTSSLSISKIAETISNPERVIGMHFFNPVEKMPLVEIVRGAKTSEAAISLTCALTSKMGKYPIVVEDVPGFLVNRILSPYLVEAAHLLSEGVSVGDIDSAATSFGMPMGPIRLLDEVGLDVATHVSEILVAGYGERMKGPEYAKILSAKKRLGKKNGIGFYRFDGKSSFVTSDLREVLGISATPKKVEREQIVKRLVYSLINEAVRCLDDGVAGSSAREAAQQIDLGSVMGFGFPPFRGGLLHYADRLGAEAILSDMRALQAQFGARFDPAPGIVKRGETKTSFYQSL